MTQATKPKPQHDAASALAHDIPLDGILGRLRELSASIESVKPLYAESDALILELARRGFTAHVMPDGTEARLVDNFLDKEGAPKLTSWKSCGVKRFDIDFTDTLSARRKDR